MMLVLATFPDKESASRAAKVLVEKRLAACVHISNGGVSLYEWEGELCQDSEYQVWVKTEKSLWEALRDEILQLHPFEVPQILGFDVTSCLPQYESWAKAMLKPK